MTTRVVPIAARIAKVTGAQPVEQPKPAPANPQNRKRFEALLQIPAFWRGCEQTRLELAGRSGWQAPTLRRSLDMKLHRQDGAAVIDADRQAVPMVDGLDEGRLRQLRVATEYFNKAKELERQKS